MEERSRLESWPRLPDRWHDTALTLQLWTQIAGKVRLALSPWLNHGWQVPLYVGARGLGTSIVHAPGGAFEIEFDLVAHRLVVRGAFGADRGFALEPMSVRDFHRRLLAELAAIGVEVAHRRHAERDRRSDPVRGRRRPRVVRRRRRARVLARARSGRSRPAPFRTGFLGKASPVHFFWGSFDLAVTRFSGRPAPPHPGGVPAPARRGDARGVLARGQQRRLLARQRGVARGRVLLVRVPEPDGFARAAVEPAGARWSTELGEWLLPYEAVRGAADPDATLLRFLETTYRAAADLARWDRGLECELGEPRRPRIVAAGDGA